MKALLVRPWVNENITTVRNFLFGEPLGIECVATVFRELGVEMELADFMVEENGKLASYLSRLEPDIVAITSQCTDVANVVQIAKESKAFDPAIQVLVGGVQATCFPDSFFVDEIDFVFKSTTRENLGILIDMLSSSKPQERIDGIYSKSLGFVNDGFFCLNEYIVPDREISARYRSEYKYVGYQPCAIVQTAYGCRNRCEFCVRWKIEGDILRELPISEIVDQIEALDEPYIMICDNDFLINESRLEEFCTLLEERNLKKGYICYGSVNSILEKPGILGRLKDNGLMAVIVGYEAFEDSRLEEYNKPASVDENIKATRILGSHNIACWGSFIIHPDWDKADFKKLVSYIRALKPELITFSPLVPHPLTPLYTQYEERLIYPVEDYEKWNFGDVLIYPSKMPLKKYYMQVMKLALVVNGNFHSVAYAIKAFPLKNTLRMLFGFRSLFGVYVRNYFAS
ncbi:MAG: cobalamin-dependent protein [Eubacteriaceae bacterium]|nr:cobalamin-dependent protein [Eubacteriaceae bacterium]